jgi:hypothetical protein
VPAANCHQAPEEYNSIKNAFENCGSKSYLKFNPSTASIPPSPVIFITKLASSHYFMIKRYKQQMVCICSKGSHKDSYKHRLVTRAENYLLKLHSENNNLSSHSILLLSTKLQMAVWTKYW